MISDTVFLELAVDCGKFQPQQLKQLQLMQRKYAEQGRNFCLFDIARHHLLTPPQAQWFVAYARQKGALAAPEAPQSRPSPPQHADHEEAEDEEAEDEEAEEAEDEEDEDEDDRPRRRSRGRVGAGKAPAKRSRTGRPSRTGKVPGKRSRSGKAGGARTKAPQRRRRKRSEAVAEESGEGGSNLWETIGTVLFIIFVLIAIFAGDDEDEGGGGVYVRGGAGRLPGTSVPGRRGK